MRVDVRQAGPVILVDFRGRLVAGTGDELLRDVINELLAEGWQKILLNLTEVDKIDSAGVGELVAGRRLAERCGSTVRLLLTPGRVHHVLELSQILPTFEVFENESEAVASFGEESC
jgi:anti-sigma B factor antagonist